MYKNDSEASKSLKIGEEIYAFNTQGTEYFSKDLNEIKQAHAKNKAKTKSKIFILRKTKDEQYKCEVLTFVQYIEQREAQQRKP